MSVTSSADLGSRVVCAQRGERARRSVAARVEAFFVGHPRLLPRVQWIMVAFYLALILLPPLLPPPAAGATVLTSFVRFARFTIWSVWWPFVLLSLVFFGRAWCGVLCPEGALTQAASRVGRGARVPGWMTWGGLPLLAFLTITVVGQLLEVDEKPLPQLLVLGGSTLLAVVVGLSYTRNARVWCRHLCPVSLLFGVFSRLGAATFRVDHARLASSPGPSPGHKDRCPVLIHLPVMATARDCHMCFRCAGWRDAIHLDLRRPGEELERIDAAEPLFWEVMFLFGGAIGLPLGVFYAEAHEVEGARLVGALLAGTLGGIALLSALTGSSALLLLGRQPVRARDLFVRLGYAYAPISLFSLFLGLSKPTFESMAAVGLPPTVAATVRTGLLLLGAVWGVVTAWRILRLGRPTARRVGLAFLPYAVGAGLVLSAWARVVL
jgi:polyferredoxin